MSGLWMALAGQIGDRTKMDSWGFSTNEGTSRDPIWVPMAPAKGIIRFTGRRVAEMIPIPVLDVDQLLEEEEQAERAAEKARTVR